MKPTLTQKNAVGFEGFEDRRERISSATALVFCLDDGLYVSPPKAGHLEGWPAGMEPDYLAGFNLDVGYPINADPYVRQIERLSSVRICEHNLFVVRLKWKRVEHMAKILELHFYP